MFSTKVSAILLANERESLKPKEKAFHLQQMVEKMLKRFYILKMKEQPPYIHNLLELAKRSNLIEQMDEDKVSLLEELNPYYIRARYPSYKKQLSDKLEQKKLNQMLSISIEVFQWLEHKIN